MIVTEAHPVPGELTLDDLEVMPFPRAALMCAPDYFDVVDVKNPFMENQKGRVNTTLARVQWNDVKQAFERCGVLVRTLPAVSGCEDMVFCANPVFAGPDAEGRLVCVPGHMRYASRRPEVDAHTAWYKAHDYRIVPLETESLFEGSGDALWHPGRRLIWGGHGPRTRADIYGRISEIFETPVIELELTTDLFYHLDTCFCPLSSTAVLVYPPALSARSLEWVRMIFPTVIEVDQHDAKDLMVCNAASFFGKYVVVQRGAVELNRRLRQYGFEVIEVDTSEFLKSGGSVFCLKMYLF